MKRMNLVMVGAFALVGWAGMPGPTFADAGEPLGVTVNGVDVSVGAGEGWAKGEDILVEITAETTVMLGQPHAFGKIEVSGGKQVVFKLTNDVELTIGTAVSSDFGFAGPTETVRALADGQNDLSLAVAPAVDPSVPRFFKVKASLLKE